VIASSLLPRIRRPGVLHPGAMATRKATRKPGRPSTGRERFIVSFAPGQLAALRREAARRAKVEGLVRVDVSGVVRQIVAEWLERQRQK